MPGYFSEELLDDIRNATSIVDVVSEHLPLKKSGRNFMGLCPFHSEKTPSFTVNMEKQIFHCFGCGEGGNVFSFVMRQQNMTFPEAVRHLAAKGGVTLPENLPSSSRKENREKERLQDANAAALHHFRENLGAPAGRKAMKYLSRRALSPETIDGFSLGYALSSWDGLIRALAKKGFKDKELLKAGLVAPKSAGGYVDRFRNRVIFPITDLQGRVVGFGGRIIDSGEPKYLNSPETPLYSKSRVLYGLPQAREHIRREGFGVVTEGYFDTLSAHQAGVGNVVATSGTALTEGHLRQMRRYTERWTVVFDGDAAGVRAAKRSLELFVSQGLFARCVLLPEGRDPDTYVREKGPEAFQKLLGEAESLMEFFIRQTVRANPIGTVEGKVAAVREIVPVLAKVRGTVELAEYVGLAAHRLNVKEEVLWSEVRAAASGKRRGDPSKTTRTVPLRHLRAEEAGIVKAMLADADVALRMKGEVSIEDLEDEDCRAVAKGIFSLLDKGLVEGIGERLHFEDERLNRLVAAWLVDGRHLPQEETALREAEDCLARIRRRRIDRESSLLQEKIAEAERAGNKETLKKLLKIKHDLRLQDGRAHQGTRR